MPQKILFKRGLRKNLPTLSVGEPAITTDTEEFFIGGANGNIPIPSQKVVDNKTDKNTVEYHFPDFRFTEYSSDCQVVKGYGKTIVIDTGSAAQWFTTIKPFLDRVVTKIDYIIITHYHYDHIENLADILRTYDVTNCMALIPPPANVGNIGSTFNNVVATLNGAGVPYKVVDESNYIEKINDDFSLRFFNTSPADYAYYDSNTNDYNSYSMCVEFRHYNQSVLMPGDLAYDGQKRVYEMGYIKNSSALYKAHHHGFDSDIYKPYMEAVNPAHIVLTTPAHRFNNRIINEGTFAYLSSLGDIYTCGHSREPIVFVTSSNGLVLKSGNKFYSHGRNFHYHDIYVDGNVPENAFQDGTEGSPFRTISAAVSTIRNIRNNFYRIYVADGTYPETVYIRNAAVNILLQGNRADPSKVKVNVMVVDSCNNVTISGFEVVSTKAAWSDNSLSSPRASIEIINSRVTLTSMLINGNWTSETPHGEDIGIFIKQSNVYIRTTEINQKGDAVRAENAAVVAVRNMSGSGNGYGFFAVSSVIISETGNTITANTLWSPGSYASGLCIPGRTTGSTSQRPDLGTSSTVRGFLYFDTTLGKPIYWNGSGWVDANGESV